MSEIELPSTIKKHQVLRPTKFQRGDVSYLIRNEESVGVDKNRNFKYPKHIFNIDECLKEAQRCLHCVNAPCRNGCPGQVDVCTLNNATAQGNYYVAAKTLLTHNPTGWTCGMLCPTNHACRGACTLADSYYGAININGIHTAVMDVFMNTNLPQIRDPSIQPQKYHSEKIALIGAGPASLSCATYLARIGYTDITIFEKRSFPGGTPAIEIPEFRIPYHITRFEAKLVEDLGVKFHYLKELGKDFTIPSLKADGYRGIFVGCGYPEANVVKQFREASKTCINVYNSKQFLTLVCNASKPGMEKHTSNDIKDASNPHPLPDLSGRVVVVGAGDVAADCCQAAFRCGASFVTLVFRRGIIDMRMNEDESEGLKREKVELVGGCSPVEVIFDAETKKATKVVCEVMRKIPGTEKYEQDNGQRRTIEFEHVITAFGSQIGKDIFTPIVINKKTWALDVDSTTMKCIGPDTAGLEGIFAGGDCVGSGTIIEGVNDGKIAAWNLHRYLAGANGVSVPEIPPHVPPFLTPVDLVDTSTTLAGIRLVNPFGLSSGPSTENTQMLRRAFKAGFGYAITKTIQPDNEMLPNVSPRVVGTGTLDQKTYLNLELNSERTLAYWVDNIPKVKEEYPARVIIASILTKSGSLSVWKDLALKLATAGVDGLQLNIPYTNKNEYTVVVRETVAAVVSALKEKNLLKVAVFVKVGFNGTGDVVSVAAAAKEAGASGVVAIDCVPGVYGIRTDGLLVPTVGTVVKTGGPSSTIGGLSGAAIRPIALAAVVQIAKTLPGFPIIASGGIENSRTAFEFLQAGASAVSIVSAVFSQGFSLITTELEDGLKYLVYQHAKEKENAVHTISGVPDHYEGFTPTSVVERRAHRDRFGYFKQKQEKVDIEDILKEPLPYPSEIKFIHEKVIDNALHVVTSLTNTPSVASVVGSALPNLAPFSELNPTLAVRAEINLNNCLNCGRCQQACFDSGYACIVFEPGTRLPKVTKMCHGCGMCESICPARCIKMVPK